MKPRPDLAAALLCALAVVGIIALAMLRQPIPDVLTYVAVGALGGAAGMSFPGSSPASSSSEKKAGPPLPSPVAAPVGATTDPAATGVFRMATHAP